MLQVQSIVGGIPGRMDRYTTTTTTTTYPHISYQSPNTNSFANQLASPHKRYDHSTYPPNDGPPNDGPPTPPVEDMNKLSLPSISRLLEISNSDKSQVEPQAQIQSHYPTPALSQGEFCDSIAQTYSQSGRNSVPSTPPLVADGSVEGNQSPASVSSHNMANHQPSYYISSQVATESQVAKRLSITTQPAIMHSYSTPAYTPTTSYNSSFVPATSSILSSSYYPAATQSYSSPTSFYHQDSRPILSSYSHHYSPYQHNHHHHQQQQQQQHHHQHHQHHQHHHQRHQHHQHHHSSGLLQHHHYISPASASNFPPISDRYVCPRCNKAFSRPSSLRIHSHSHTGEKPFKCGHKGCGKAFSVRSNMKRHERGCHAAMSN